MIKASFEKRIFTFKKPSGTSRGILTEKKAWFISVWKEKQPEIIGVGECSVIPLLSPDYIDDSSYEKKIKEVAENINHYAQKMEELMKFPSIYFGLEMALLDLENGGNRIFFNTEFTKGRSAIPINGLIWMGTAEFMQEQIQQKLKEGFSCLKMKIGAIDFQKELEILKKIREQYKADEITLRVDANGAFSAENVIEKLNQLSLLEIHSIEQPIKQGQSEKMKDLCLRTPLPIALDEELIGIYDWVDKKDLLETIRPQYIILKPSLVGGFKGTVEWIEIAESLQIPWWITSALESNVGLEAIAQFTSKYSITIPQGLGTGSLYLDNIPSKLTVKNGMLLYE